MSSEFEAAGAPAGRYRPEGPTWGPQGACSPFRCKNPLEVPTPNPWSRCWSPAQLHPYAPTPLSPYYPHRCQRFVRVVRQGVPRRAQRQDVRRAQKIRRDDVTRWQPTLNVGEGLDPSHGSPQGAPLHCRRRPSGEPPGRTSLWNRPEETWAVLRSLDARP